MSSHYRTRLQNLEFCLDLFGAEILGEGPFEAYDRRTAVDMLRESDRVAREELAPSFGTGDRNPPEFDRDTHSVRMHPDVRAAYARLMGSGMMEINNEGPRLLWWLVQSL